MRFVDTNVLLYAISRDPGEHRKAERAVELLAARDLALSVQVLQEFYVEATRSSRPDRLPHTKASDLVTAFTRFTVLDLTVPLVHAAMEGRDRYGLSYWDAAIIAAARTLGCDQVLSEDLSHGQDYDGVIVLDPFR
ncbi:PIN domain-containing protein [Georgenia satyanarayanai]|uniref:PIN domain-containing protein n=1 Tax=Georgenia satyanarayanai TaxID=860221 RepID=UPI00203F026D|nr:PIN domain-containing protein [Georgenia satyanarayanai]MCM3659387.1 PIN domain-containing protein [Georgenia satyanarayanai]